ncbi:hypothetical protein [Gelatiniphilus marinus]|uniref:Lipoprotein n=1 Tax=Gelatiniphilus marinus TaxID=1759464 RepID=A0ABW5JUP4_9FLAO
MKTITLIFILITLSSCNNKTKTEAISVVDNLELKLNNSEKWLANKETHVGMQRIDSILKNNRSADGITLGNALSKETSYIIKSCNMTGEAHDQLHVVLVPILEEITEIKDLDNPAELNKKVAYLQRLTATYFKYFKI